MPPLQAHGIDVALPAGWDGRISVRDDGAPYQAFSVAAGATPVATLRSRPVAHFANFGLPADRGDFGSGAVELMGDQDVFVVLFEHEPDAAATPLFRAEGLPRALVARDFDPATLRRGIAGQSAHQAFFHESGRAFCLYVVLGSHARRARLVPLVNRVLMSVQIAPPTGG
jgi:hypothetical protein